MKPANDPETDYKALVARGYDHCAATYIGERAEETNPEIIALAERLGRGATVLDIGCGAGVPITRPLAERFDVTGVDISPEQIRLARENVPTARFLCSDIMSVDFPPAAFDAVVAFYAIIHLPRDEHPELLDRIHGWLKPGGYFLATFARRAEEPYTEDDFYGAKMFWSNYGVGDYQDMLSSLGFRILESRTIGHGYRRCRFRRPEKHPLILAQKDGGDGAQPSVSVIL